MIRELGFRVICPRKGIFGSVKQHLKVGMQPSVDERYAPRHR